MIDVIIVGSGGAGLSAALGAKEAGASVLVISKTFPTHSQTVQAQGGINAVLYKDKNDSIEEHINDTYTSSRTLSNKSNIKFMCDNGKETIKWLDKLGVPFSRNEEDNIAQRPFGGTKAIRTCYSSDYTGLKILHTLYDNCLKQNIDFLYEHILVDLIIDNNRVVGVKVLNLLNSEINEIYSKTVILATGGYSNIFSGFTTNSNLTTGDGIAIAFNRGAKLSNLEFVQFHPTALKYSNTLISESARAEGAYLVTKEGDRFVDELRTRDIVARAIKDKILEGKEVYLDLRHLDIKVLKEKMPQEIKLIKDLLNLDVTKDLIPINPAAHYTMGGIYANVSCETSIENLYAVGECAQIDIHGANRLGGNSLLEIITFGKTSGINASHKAREIKGNKVKKPIVNEIDDILNKEGKESIYEIKNELGSLLFEKVGLYREKISLQKALDKIKILKKRFVNTSINDKSKTYNKNLIDYMEIKNLLTIAELVTVSAINREESRGSHYRKDFPNEDKEFEKISILYKKDYEIIHTFEGIE